MAPQGSEVRIPEHPLDRDAQHARQRNQTYGRITVDPTSPIDGWTWLRADLDPPELRVTIDGTTFRLPFVPL